MAMGKLMITLGIIVISIQLSSAILCLCKWTNKVNTFCCLGLHKCCPTPPPYLPPPPQYHVHNEYYGAREQYPAPDYHSAGAPAPPSPPAAAPVYAAPSAPMAAPAAPSAPKPQYGGQSEHLGMVYNPPAPAPAPAPPGHYAPSNDYKGESDYYKYLYGDGHK